jgi:hypothetical protein
MARQYAMATLAYLVISVINDCWKKLACFETTFTCVCQISCRHGIQHDDSQHTDIQHNDTQHNGTQHTDIEHTDIQHNDIQRTGIMFKRLVCYLQHSA